MHVYVYIYIYIGNSGQRDHITGLVGVSCKLILWRIAVFQVVSCVTSQGKPGLSSMYACILDMYFM